MPIRSLAPHYPRVTRKAMLHKQVHILRPDEGADSVLKSLLLMSETLLTTAIAHHFNINWQLTDCLAQVLSSLACGYLVYISNKNFTEG